MIVRRRATTTTPMSSTQSEKTVLVTKPTIGDSNNSLSRTFIASKPIATPNPYKYSPSNAGSDWDMTSLMDDLPKSPSPICSRGSSGSTTSLSSTPTCFPSSDNALFSRFPGGQSSSPPRKQSFCIAWDKDSGIELDELTNHGNQLGSLFLSDPQLNFLQGNMSSPSKSGNLTFLQESKSQPMTRGALETSDGGSPDALQRNLMTRPKPYSAYLDEVKQQEFEAELEAWRRAKEEALLDKLRRKEALISEWEFRQTSKAMEEMKKYERKLEKKRVKALEKLKNKIRLAKAEADKKSRKAKRETVEKMSEISKLSIKACVTKNLASLKL